MCWSFEVSVAFALVEAASITFLYLRAKRSSDPYIQAQVTVLPLLATILMVEVAEALIWLDATLTSVTATEGPTCSTYNTSLTMVFWFLVFPWQPLCCIFPCRRVGHPRNRDLFAGVELVAWVLPFWHLLCYLGQVIPQWMLGDAFHPAAPRLNIQQHAYQIFVNSETCTYIGPNGHLFWTLATADCSTTPNMSCYILLCCSLAYARPKRFVAGIALFMVGLVVALNSYYQGSVETGSMWCWTGILMHAYFIVQPYVLPCNEKNSFSPNTHPDAVAGGDVLQSYFTLPLKASSLGKGQ